ncbi:MAG: hypothetical protein HRU38_15020 [Saccharospirillaceae bacterium]|nr:hypothetical protein [Pseudomonadales bacterium]NRB79953.1 hypothetical protein [Saccharospirillaceae bacterium]
MKHILLTFLISISTNLLACEIPPSYPNIGITHDSISKWTITAGALLKKAEDGKFHFLDESVCSERMDGLIIRGNLGSKGFGAEIGWGFGFPFMGTNSISYSYLFLPKSHSRFKKGSNHGIKLSINAALLSFNIAPYINHNGDIFFSAGIGLGI